MQQQQLTPQQIIAGAINTWTQGINDYVKALTDQGHVQAAQAVANLNQSAQNELKAEINRLIGRDKQLAELEAKERDPNGKNPNQ